MNPKKEIFKSIYARTRSVNQATETSGANAKNRKKRNPEYTWSNRFERRRKGQRSGGGGGGERDLQSFMLGKQGDSEWIYSSEDGGDPNAVAEKSLITRRSSSLRELQRGAPERICCSRTAVVAVEDLRFFASVIYVSACVWIEVTAWRPIDAGPPLEFVVCLCPPQLSCTIYLFFSLILINI